MVKSLRVLNFRCFKHLELKNLARVNVLVGKNGSGKTSFLEALYVAAGGTPEIALRLRRWRGFGAAGTVFMTKEGYESLWRDLFFNFDAGAGAMIEMTGDAETTRKLLLEYRPSETVTLPLTQPPTDSSLITPLVFESTDSSGTVVPSRLVPTPEGIVRAASSAQPVLAAFFNSISLFDGPAEAASQFSTLRQKNQADGVLKALKSVFPLIESLSVEIVSGLPTLCGQIPPFPFPQPIALASGGMTKLLHILLGIASQAKGIVLIDEIENGFYYDAMPVIWTTIHAIAREYETQVFTSTHSLECLRALLPVLENHQDDFCLIKTERKGTEGTAYLSPGDVMAAAIRQDFEVR